eukprot:12126932-Alexandrium_andersonii.AAC.1
MAETMVQANSQLPVMYIYMADGWSTDISSRHRLDAGDLKVARHARARQEFLLERGIVRCLPSGVGARTLAMLVRPPRILSAGKTSWNM